MLAGLALLSLAVAAVIGFFGVLLFFASAALVIGIQPLTGAGQIGRLSPLLLLPLLAIVSTLWSDAPGRSMRVGLELFLTFVAAILICCNLRLERMILLLFLALVVMGLLTIPYIPFSLASGTPLVAAMGSKNQVGTLGYLISALSLALICDRAQPGPARLAAIAAAPFGLLLAWLAQSGGTTSSIALTLIVFPPLALLVVVRPTLRLALTMLTLCVLVAAYFFLDDIETAITEFRQNVLKKDATLTGRTYLWEVADRLSAARPGLGYGYGAFWRQGNIDAEGLWRWGGIASRSGFNFHNAFIGMRVDLGLVGMGLLILNCVVILGAALIRQIARPSVALACLVGMTTVNYFRSLVEEGLVAPFSLITLIWLATGIYAFSRPAPTGSGAGDAGARLAAGGARGTPRRGVD